MIMTGIIHLNTSIKPALKCYQGTNVLAYICGAFVRKKIYGWHLVHFASQLAQ